MTCAACRSECLATTSAARARSGATGSAATKDLCWICRRLYLAVAREAVELRAYFAKIEKDGID